MEDEILRLVEAGRAFDEGRIVALWPTSLTIRSGELIAVTGASGSGKSTLLSLLSGIEAPSAGQVLFEGEGPLTPGAWAALRSRRIGVISQDFNLLPSLTAVENVEVAMMGRLRRGADRRREALARLAEAGVAEIAARRPPQLSGGERRRVGVARALANNPDLLLADEPTSNLDSVSGAAVLDLLLSLHRTRSVTLVIVTHDASVTASCDRHIAMADGRVIGDESRDVEAA
jgi:putative ABC transport system ATP-binding protein